MQPTPLLLSFDQDSPQAEQAPATTAHPAGTSPQQTPTSPFGSLTSFLPLIAIFAVFYFVLIAPERKKNKQRQEMLKQIKKGDKVMTTGGMFATVAAIQDDEVTLQIAENVRARFARSAVQTVVADDKPADGKKS